jgi:4-carboxymuconolactone decarboxylase
MSKPIRVPLVQPGTRPELAEIERAIALHRGDISVLYQVLLNSAPVAAGWERLLTAVRNETTIPPALRELVILRVAVLNRATFEFEAHVPHARLAGIPDAKMEALRRWSADGREGGTPDGVAFSDDERLMLELADAMTRDIQVPDALMERLRARFDARGVVEAVTTVAAYNMVSRLLVALGIEH